MWKIGILDVLVCMLEVISAIGTSCSRYRNVTESITLKYCLITAIYLIGILSVICTVDNTRGLQYLSEAAGS